MKTAEEWQAEFHKQNVSPSGNVYHATIEQLGAIMLEAHQAGMTEAADIVSAYANEMRGAHVNTNDSCGRLRARILTARDAKKV